MTSNRDPWVTILLLELFTGTLHNTITRLHLNNFLNDNLNFIIRLNIFQDQGFIQNYCKVARHHGRLQVRRAQDGLQGSRLHHVQRPTNLRSPQSQLERLRPNMVIKRIWKLKSAQKEFVFRSNFCHHLILDNGDKENQKWFSEEFQKQ